MRRFNFTATGFQTVDLTTGIENLPPRANRPSLARLAVAENVRFTSNGGVQNRLGFTQKADLGTSARVDHIVTNVDYDCMLCKSGTKIFQSLDGTTWYDIGLTQTAAERTFLFPYGKDVFAVNQTDSFTRIAFSTADGIISASDTEITVRTGDAGQFATSGTIYIRGDAITYTGKSGSDLTGVTGIQAGGHPDGSIITQTSTPTGGINGLCMAELYGHGLIGNQPTEPSTLGVSLPANPDEPELFYDFRTSVGATQKTMPSDVTAMKGGKGGVLVGMKNGVEAAIDFNEEFGGALYTKNVSRVHSIPNALCIADMGDSMVILTTDGRVLPVRETDSGFVILEDEEVLENNFDYPISKYVSENKDSDNSDNWIFYDPKKRTVHATIKMDTGITQTFVRQRDTGGWSIDTSKNFSYMTSFKGRVYAGSDSDDKIYIDEELRTDADVPIASRIATGLMTLDQKRVTGDYDIIVLSGLLSHPGQFTFRVAVDGEEIDERIVTSDDLIDNSLMSITSGVFIGGGLIGAEGVGSAGNLTEAFMFTFPYEFLAEGESAQVELEVTDESTAAEFRDLKVSGETNGELLIPTF